MDSRRPRGVVLFWFNAVASADRIIGVYEAVVGVSAILTEKYVPNGLGLKISMIFSFYGKSTN